MDEFTVMKKDVIDSVIDAVKGEGWGLAAWEMGAMSWGRFDEWSDIDLIVVVKDEHVEDAFTLVEKVLESLGGIEERFRIPEPAWHGHSQCFYKIKGASPYLLFLSLFCLNYDK